MENEERKSRYVTQAELMSAIQERATKWEVRALILAAVVANRFLPDFTPTQVPQAVQYFLGLIL